MMKQRRRLLMSDKFILDDIFKNATYIASGGNDASSQGYARISKSVFLSDKKYYIIGYHAGYYVIFTYYNSILTKIYEHITETHILNISSTYYSGYLSLSDSGDYTKYSFGIIALAFDVDMDKVFSNISVTAESNGAEDNGDTPWGLSFNQLNSNNTTVYIFTGVGHRFCIYKSLGATYSDLIPLFNHELYLVNDEDIYARFSLDGITAIRTYGFSVFTL